MSADDGRKEVRENRSSLLLSGGLGPFRGREAPCAPKYRLLNGAAPGKQRFGRLALAPTAPRKNPTENTPDTDCGAWNSALSWERRSPLLKRAFAPRSARLPE